MRNGPSPRPPVSMAVTPLLVVAALCAAGAGLVGQDQRANGATYVTAVNAYRECHDDDARRLLASVPPDYLLWVAGAPPELMPVAGEKAYGAALLLHTRLFLALPSDQQLEHRRVAAHLSELLLTSGASNDVGELSYALLAIQQQEETLVYRLVEVLARLPAGYRRAPRALLAGASIHQLLSTPMVSLRSMAAGLDGPLAGMRLPPPPLDEWGRQTVRTARGTARANRDRAMLLLRDTIAAWPADAEASLRLAFLLTEDRRFTEAREAFDGAAHLDRPPVLQYFEALTRARLAEGEGRAADAVSAYSRARSILPGAQTPLLALARLQFMSGRADAARDALLGSLPVTSPAVTADPRWQLMFGQTWRRNEYLQRLGGMVRQCGS